jgi:hypothetical protein
VGEDPVVAVVGGRAQDAHTGEFLGDLESMCIGRLLRLVPPKEKGIRTIRIGERKPPIPAHPFHDSLESVVHILAGDPRIVDRFLNEKLLSYRKAGPLDLLAAQGEP